MYALNVMTTKVATIHPDTYLDEAIRLMLEKGVSGIPVTDANGNLVGIVTEGDLLRRTEIGTEKQHKSWFGFLVSDAQRAREYFLSHARKIGDLMTTEVVAVTPTTPLEEVVSLMEKHHIKRVPVLQDKQLVGIVTRSDLLKALIHRPATNVDTNDETIQKLILAEIAKHPWAPQSMIDVIVRDGVVELRGTILDDRFRDALRVIAENVPGVKSVNDRLVWIEPISGVVLGPGS